MTDSAFKIVGIMSRGDLDCTGSVMKIDENGISYDLNNSVFNKRVL